MAAEFANAANRKMLIMFLVKCGCLYHFGDGGGIGVDVFASPAPITRGERATACENCRGPSPYMAERFAGGIRGRILARIK
jgi:hypothetical protein